MKKIFTSGLKCNSENCEEAARALEQPLDEIEHYYLNNNAEALCYLLKLTKGTSRELTTNRQNLIVFAAAFGGHVEDYVPALLGSPLKLADALYASCKQKAKDLAYEGQSFDAIAYLDGAARNKGWGSYAKGVKVNEGG